MTALKEAMAIPEVAAVLARLHELVGPCPELEPFFLAGQASQDHIPCPFCGADSHITDDVTDRGVERYGECASCGATGPRVIVKGPGDTRRAIAMWMMSMCAVGCEVEEGGSGGRETDPI